MLKTSLLLAAALLAFTASAPAQAATVTFTSDHCTGGCGDGSATGQPGGFATLSANELGGGQIGFTLTPNNGNGFISTGLHSFTFNLVNDPTITYSSLPSGFNVIGGFGAGNLSQNAGAIMQDGFGTFEYGIDYASQGGSNPLFSPFSFIIQAMGLTLASLNDISVGGNPSAFFALDILSGTTGRTGLVDASTALNPTTVGQVPLPGALPLFLTGLAGIGWMARKRKKIIGSFHPAV